MAVSKCFGIAGWKNSGKTTLVAGLVAELSARGLVVSTIKHAHHTFDLDQKETDSFKHREAGAREVLLVSEKRWALQHELSGNGEPPFDEMLKRLSPCDLVLVEGYKREPIPRIEVLGPTSPDQPLWKSDPHVKAIAAESAIEGSALPFFRRDQYTEIADFILNFHGIE